LIISLVDLIVTVAALPVAIPFDGVLTLPVGQNISVGLYLSFECSGVVLIRSDVHILLYCDVFVVEFGHFLAEQL